MDATPPQVGDFDLKALPGDYIADPYRYFAALRDEAPVHRMADGSYLLTRYDDMVAVYRNPAVWSSDKKLDFAPKFGDTPLYEHHTTSLVFRDPPDHTRIRKLFQAAFTRKALAALEERIVRLVDGYLDRLEDQGQMELVSELSFRLPVQVVCDMLGVRPEDRILIRDWAIAILGGLEPTLTREQFDTGNRSVEDFKTYLRDLIKERRHHPGNGSDGEVLTALMAAEEDGQKLTELELLHNCIFLLNAGHETSTNMVSHGVNELLNHPQEAQRLRDNPELIEDCIEEILRYQAPIQINNRRALSDTALSGVALPEGSMIHLMLGAANRDPSQFPDPDRFDIGRRPNRHLSFGLGIHICAGNSLARIEGRIVFEKLVNRFPTLHATGPAVLANRVRFREIKELRVAV